MWKKFNLLQFSYSGKKSFSSILAQWMGDEKWLTCIEIKSWYCSDQMRLKSLQIVQFECPGHCNPSHYTTLRVIDLSVEDHIQSWFRSKFFQIVQFEYSFHYNIAFLIQIWIIDLHWYSIYWGVICSVGQFISKTYSNLTPAVLAFHQPILGHIT